MEKIISKALSLGILILLTLSMVETITPTFAAPQVATLNIINPGPDGYPEKWTAGPPRYEGTDRFIFYSNETDPGDTFFINVTVIDAIRTKVWGIGIIFNRQIVEYVSAWRPTDHIFKPVEEMGWTLVAPSVAIEVLDPTRSLLKWGCAYIMGTPEWCFNGTGTLCQIQFRIIKEVSRLEPFVEFVFTWDPDWTMLGMHPTGTQDYVANPAYFRYEWARPVKFPKFYIKPPEIKPAKVGDRFSIDVWVRDVEAGWCIIGFQFSVWYNTTLVDSAPTDFEVGDWMKQFIDLGEDIIYKAYNDFHGDPELPYCYNKWMAFIMITPGTDNKYWAPFPSGEGMLFKFYFTAIYETEFPKEVWMWFELHDLLVLDKYNQRVEVATPLHATYRAPIKVPGLVIDVYTQHAYPYGGQGLNNPSDMFAPQAEVNLFALVTYNDNPVQQKLVAFEICHEEFSIYREAITDENGIAWIAFRIPWPCVDPVKRVFGEWNVIATVEVAEILKNDTLTFKVWWPVEIISVKSTYPAYIYNKAEMPTMEFVVEYRTYSMQTIPVTLTVAVYDELGFFIGYAVFNTTVGWGEYGHYCEFISYTWTTTIPMPSHAVVGLATVYANAYNKLPWEGGTPYCPEASDTFWIRKA